MPNIPPGKPKEKPPEWPQREDPFKYKDVWPEMPAGPIEMRQPIPQKDIEWIHRPTTATPPSNRPQSMKRGGMIHRTALYRLHSGERVLPKSMARRYSEEKHGGKMDAGCRERD